MTRRSIYAVLVLSAGVAAVQAAVALPMPESSPIVIAHRGASGYRPEHTLEAYALAIEMGADVIEPDLVSTRDGVLIARHENEIGATTDVAEKFPARRTTKSIDGKAVSGWFTEDFTYAEIMTLRAKERLAFRSHAFDGQFRIPTFAEVIDLAVARSRATGRTVGVYPETKHPSYFRSIGLPLEAKLVALLGERGWNEKYSPVFIQSFEPASLEILRPLTRARLVLLTSDPSVVTPAALEAAKAFSDGLGVEKRLVLPVADDGRVQAPTALVAQAHAAGLFVHVWTLRREADFLPAEYAGDLGAEARRFFAAGVDGIFTDFPDLVIAARPALR